MTKLPDPNKIYPDENVKSIVFLKNVVKNPNIKVGKYYCLHFLPTTFLSMYPIIYKM